tara:strand:+ start:112 stop:267 length:156 start_codon:yes stop_codon:yes gene_type:complete
MKQLKYIVTTTFADEYILFALNLKDLVNQVNKLKSKYNILNDEIVSIKESA